MGTIDFRSSLDQGLLHFNAARFFQAHEVWEAGWRVTAAGEKQLLQVLVLWAAAYHHATKGNRSGAVKLLARALERLDRPVITLPPFELEALREALVTSWESLSVDSAQSLTAPEWSPVPVDVASDEVDLVRRTSCPYCGTPVAVEVEPELCGGAEYVEDCPVCCRPWTVRIRDDAGQPSIGLHRGDE